MKKEYSESELIDFGVEYWQMEQNPSESKLVPHNGNCEFINDENEIINQIQNLIVDRIIPENIISVSDYLIFLRSVFTERLAFNKMVEKDPVNDIFNSKCVIITERLINWLNTQIEISKQQSYIDKKKIEIVANKLANESYNNKGDKYINNAILDDFIAIMTGMPITQKITWSDTDWKLYVIIEHFVNLKLFPLADNKITGFIIHNFHFPDKKMTPNIIDSNVKRGKRRYIYEDFTTKISQITTE